MKQILIQRIKLYSVSHLHYRSVRWSVLRYSNSVNSLGTFWIIVVQVCDINSNRCHSLTLFRCLSLLCEHLRFQIKSCRFEVASQVTRRGIAYRIADTLKVDSFSYIRSFSQEPRMVVESGHKIIPRCMLPVGARKFLRHFSLPREVWKQHQQPPDRTPTILLGKKKETHSLSRFCS